MIRALRERHRRLVPILALLVAAAILVALLGRAPRTATTIPGALRPHADQP